MEETVGKDSPKQGGGKAPNTGNTSATKRDDKMSTTEKSKNPNRPHVDK